MGKKNSKGGNKHRKSANKRDYSRGSRDLVVPEKGQSVATVNKPFGNGMFEVHLYADHSDVKGRVCGTFRHKRVFIRAGDIVLVSFRDCDSAEGHRMVDIIHKYNQNEAAELANLGHMSKVEDEGNAEEDTGIVFEGQGGNDEEDNEKTEQDLLDLIDDI